MGENMLEKDFKEIASQIKLAIQSSQVKIMSEANQELLNLYFNVGKYISENASWGNNFINNLEIEIKLDFPNIKGFSARNLRDMRRFYEEYKDDLIWQPVVAKLPWTHNMILISKVQDKNIRKWYFEKALEEGWSNTVLTHQLELKLYEKQPETEKLNNFSLTTINPFSDLANEMQKDPYIFNLPLLKDKFIETELENALVDRIKATLLELGKGFSFVGNQWKVSDGEKDYFIDLLFYHLDLRCYVVVELKTTDFSPEHTGQLNFYVTAIDETMKKDIDNPTIGLLLCKNKNKIGTQWALKNIHTPIGISSYEITKILPKELENNLPTEDDINLHINIDEDKN